MAREFNYDASYFDEVLSRSVSTFDKESKVEYANKFLGDGKIVRLLPLKYQNGPDFFRIIESYYFAALNNGLKSPRFFDKKGVCLIEEMIKEAKKSKDANVLKKVSKDAYSLSTEYYLNFIEINPDDSDMQPFLDSKPKILCLKYTCFKEIQALLRTSAKRMSSFLKAENGLNIRIAYDANSKKYRVLNEDNSTISDFYYEDENLNDIDEYLSFIIKHPSYIKNYMEHYLYNKKLDPALDKLKYKDYLAKEGKVDNAVYDEEDNSSVSEKELEELLTASKK